MNKTLTAILAAAACSVFAADEIVVTANLGLTSGALAQSQRSGDVKLTMTNAVPIFNAGTLAVAQTPVALPVGDVAAVGYLWLKNASTNGVITGGPTNAAGAIMSTVILKPTGVALFQKGTEPFYFEASTGTVYVQHFLITE